MDEKILLNNVHYTKKIYADKKSVSDKKKLKKHWDKLRLFEY